MLQKRLFITIVVLLAGSLAVGGATLVKSQAQTPESGVSSEGLPVITQSGPLGFKSQRGIEGLQKLLQVSQPTASPSVRQVVVPIPPDISKDVLNRYPGVIAIAEFYQIVEKEPSPPGSPEKSNFDVEGRKGRLPGGGILHLRVNSNKSLVTATIGISGIKVPGYEQVRQIEFVLPSISAP